MADGWFRGDRAATRILLLADRFRDLLRIETGEELNEEFSFYTPWMAVRSRRQALRSLMRDPLPPSSPALVTQPETLSLLADALNDPATNPLGTIVPYDIKARIDTSFVDEGQFFERALVGAKALLAAHTPWIHTLLTRMVSQVVPILHRLEGQPVKRGFSSPLCYGAVFLTFEDRHRSLEVCAAELAIDLAHETGHHSLHTYQTADPILQSDLRAPVYSGVKKIERPAIMSLHASAALLFMLEISAKLMQNQNLHPAAREHAMERFAWMLMEQRKALEAIRDHVEPTALGRHIIMEMEEQIAEFERIATQ